LGTGIDILISQLKPGAAAEKIGAFPEGLGNATGGGGTAQDWRYM